MFDRNKLAEEVKLQTQQVAVTSKFMGLIGFGQKTEPGASSFGAIYDSLVANAAKDNVSKAAFIPQALLDLEEKVGKAGMSHIFDSIDTGVKAYRNRHGGAMPDAALVASAINAGSLLHTGLDRSQTNGLFDSASDAFGGPEVQQFYDSVSKGGSTHTAEVPSLAMVTIAMTIANAMPVVSYLPNPKGTNTVPLVYVRQVAANTYGQTEKNEFLDGLKAANQYFDAVHRFEMVPNADRKTFTITTKRCVDPTTLKPVDDAGSLPFVLGGTAITVGGVFVAHDEQSNQSGGSTTGTFNIYPQDVDGFTTKDGINKVASGRVDLSKDQITVTFEKAIPEGVSVKASVYANFEAKDNNGNYILQAPSVDTRNEYGSVSAYAIRAIYTASIDSITQMQNELGVDVRAAFVAVVIGKLMFEQTCRLLKEARDLAEGSFSADGKLVLVRELDLSRGNDLTQAFNKSADIIAEVIPALEDMKRRITERTAHSPDGYDVYVTGSLSTLVRSLADDTNFIPTGLTLGVPNNITRIGSRGTDNFYYVPSSAGVLNDGELKLVIGVDDTDPANPKQITEDVTFGEMLIIARNSVAAKSVFIGHIAVPVITEDVRAKSFEQGVTVYTRQAAQLNRNSRFGGQVALLRVIKLVKAVTTELSEKAA